MQSEPPSIRIYCDWNDGIDSDRYSLSSNGATEDLASLSDGLPVILYMTDEIEAEGRIYHDSATGQWIGVPDRSTFRDIGFSAWLKVLEARGGIRYDSSAGTWISVPGRDTNAVST